MVKMRMTPKLLKCLAKDTNGEPVTPEELKLLTRYKGTPDGWIFSARRHIGKAMDRIEPMELMRIVLSTDPRKAREAFLSVISGVLGAKAFGGYSINTVPGSPSQVVIGPGTIFTGQMVPPRTTLTVDPSKAILGAFIANLGLRLAEARGEISEGAGLGVLAGVGILNVPGIDKVFGDVGALFNAISSYQSKVQDASKANQPLPPPPGRLTGVPNVYDVIYDTQQLADFLQRLGR